MVKNTEKNTECSVALQDKKSFPLNTILLSVVTIVFCFLLQGTDPRFLLRVQRSLWNMEVLPVVMALSPTEVTAHVTANVCVALFSIDSQLLLLVITANSQKEKDIKADKFHLIVICVPDVLVLLNIILLHVCYIFT